MRDSGDRIVEQNRRSFVKLLGAGGALAALPSIGRAAKSVSDIEVLAYYFPAWHQDARWQAWHGPARNEWDLLRAARARYPGHRQPKQSAWGEFDESDPKWSSREIDLAADHGLTGFIYDWYWYEGAPFLNGALERGFLQAPNRSRMKFALMWANHDWLDLFPAPPGKSRRLVAKGAVDRAEFERATTYILEKYFRQPNYLRLDGKLYFSIYELGTLLKGLGGVEGARAALDGFRSKVRTAGLGELHLNAVVWGVTVLPSEHNLPDPGAVVRALGFSSLTTYAWVHHYPAGERSFPRDSYAEAANATYAAWDRYSREFGVPYHPNVSMGWDPSPRTQQDAPFAFHGYPWTGVLEGNTPAAFKRALDRAKLFVKDGATAEQRVVTLNAWNEWTEGSYLLPDRQTGKAYLQAVRRVFGAQS